MLTKEERIETRRVAEMLIASLQKAITPPMSALTDSVQRIMLSAPATVIQLLDSLDEMERERDAGRQREEEIGAAVSRARAKCNGTLAQCVDALAAERDEWEASAKRCAAERDHALANTAAGRHAMALLSTGRKKLHARIVDVECAHDDLKASRDYWLDQSEALKRERAALANECDEWKTRAERQRIIISAIGDHILENQGGEVDAAVGSAVQSIDASTDLTYSSVRDILHDAV